MKLQVFFCFPDVGIEILFPRLARMPFSRLFFGVVRLAPLPPAGAAAATVACTFDFVRFPGVSTCVHFGGSLASPETRT